MTSDDQDRIYVADERNHRIQCLDCNGNFVFEVGVKGTERGEFQGPTDVAFDSSNRRILVVDTLNHRIQAFDLDGCFLFSFGFKGRGKGQFYEPYGIAIDHYGIIYVSEWKNHRVQVLDSEGNFLHFFGSLGISQGELKFPVGIGLFPNGDLAVAERGNRRISIFDPQGRFVRFIGEKHLKDPWWLFIDSLGHVLVADNADETPALILFSNEGELLKRIGQGAFNWVNSVIMNQQGEIVVSGCGKDDVYHLFVF